MLLWLVCLKPKGLGNPEESLTRVECLGVGRSEARPLGRVPPELDEKERGREERIGKSNAHRSFISFPSQILMDKIELRSSIRPQESCFPTVGQNPHLDFA